MAVRLRMPGTAAWFVTILPLLVAGCGQSEDNAASTPAVKPGAPTGTSAGAGAQAGGAPGAAASKPDKYAYYGHGDDYTPEQKHGRDTWIMWTGGNQAFFRLGSVKAGEYGIPIQYFRLLDSRDRSTRFKRLGLINEPNFRQATKPDQYGLWLDEWLGDDTYPDTKTYGEPTGVIGLRKFPNPKFDPAKWNLDAYYRKPNTVEPPYLMGMACGFCHMGFSPIKPPADPENPRWENLAANLGNQFLKEGAVFFGEGKIVFGGDNNGKGLGDEDFLYHYGESQQRGTSETSRLSYDFINNPNTMNSIFYLESRPSFKESLNPESRKQIAALKVDPDKVPVHHVLKDGSDSQTIPIASIRVYVNIGMCGSYWIEQLWNPAKPDVPQKAFDMGVAAAKFPEWTATLNRMPDLEKYLATYTPMRLEKAEEGKHSGVLVIPDSYKNGTSEQKEKWKVVERGQTVFAENCAFCHSSKQPTSGDDLKALETLRAYYTSGKGVEDEATKKASETVKAYFRTEVAKDDFLDKNILTDDVRYPVSELKTSAARALATNAMGGHIWDQFSSPEYKSLPASPPLTLYNPVTGKNDRVWQPPAGGRGYYRTSSLVSIWASAPFLHNNSVGTFNGDPQVAGRVAAFDDAIHKLLWPTDRDGVKSIKRVKTRTNFNIRLSVLGSVAHQAILAFKPELPDLPGIKLPELPFKFVEDDELKNLPGLDKLDRISLKIAVPEGTPINLLANINLSDPAKVLPTVLAYLRYAFQTDVAAAARKLPIGGDLAAKLPEQRANAAMDDLLKLSEYPDLVEDHGHEYGAELGDDDKKALIEYLKKL